MDPQHPRHQLVAFPRSRTTAKHQCSSSPTSTATSSPPPTSPKPRPNSHPRPTPASSASRRPAPPPNTPGSARCELPTELPSGVTAMGAPILRTPDSAASSNPTPVPGGSANAYAYTFADPVNSSDPTGAYTMTITAFEVEQAAEQSQKVEENHMAEKRAAEEAAARASRQRSRRTRSRTRRSRRRTPIRSHRRMGARRMGRMVGRRRRMGIRVRSCCAHVGTGRNTSRASDSRSATR